MKSAKSLLYIILLYLWTLAPAGLVPALGGEKSATGLASAETSAPRDSSSHTVILSRDPVFPSSARDFSCREKVYAIIFWKGLREGPHKLTALWFNPEGVQDNQYDLEFVAVEGHTMRNWISLQFHLPKKKPGLLLSSPALARLEGDWEVRLYLDGEPLESKRFLVHCE